MKRFVLSLVLLILGLGIVSKPLQLTGDPISTSSTMMALTTSPVFLSRLTYFMFQQAGSVLAENHSTTCHSARIAFARYVIGNPAQAAANAAPLVVSSNVGGAVIVGTAVQWSSGSQFPNQWDSSAGDTAIQTAIDNMWNTFSSCDTGA